MNSPVMKRFLATRHRKVVHIDVFHYICYFHVSIYIYISSYYPFTYASPLQLVNQGNSIYQKYPMMKINLFCFCDEN